MSSLVDQFGDPFPPEAFRRLGEAVAAPSSFNARAPFVGHLAFGVDPGRLGMILRAADTGNSRDWMILAEEIEELYVHYAATLSKRKRQVTLLPLTVEGNDKVPDGEKHADLIREWLEMEVLEHALYDVADAMGKGFSASELIWEQTPEHAWPTDIIWRNPRDFEQSTEDGETIWLRGDTGFLPLEAHKFLLHKHPLKSGNAVRGGLTRVVAWLWMYQTYTQKDWALFVQGYGLPVRLGRYGPDASDTDKRTLFRAVRQIGGDLAAAIPKNMEMEFVQPGNLAGAAELYMNRANWLDQQVSKLVLGGTAGMDAIAGGHAVGKEHRAGEQDVEKFDAKLLANSVNQQIVQAIVAFTFGPQKGYPRIVIGIEEKVPLSDVIASVADLGPLGFKVKSSDIYDRLQLTAPDGSEDDIIGMPPAAPAGALDADGNPLVKADLTPKPNPHPVINPNSDERALMTRNRQLGARMRRMIALHTAATAQTQVIDALNARVERDAGLALDGMTDEVRACFDAAEDLEDLAARLRKLDLTEKGFGTAMMQGLALANLAGSAELLDEIAAAGRA